MPKRVWFAFPGGGAAGAATVLGAFAAGLRLAASIETPTIVREPADGPGRAVASSVPQEGHAFARSGVAFPHCGQCDMP
jgi:hypothetical protein